MTPEGHALSAWITFSAYRDGDETVVQAQALERTSDPFIELTDMVGASRSNDRFWEQTLANLGRSLGVPRPVAPALGPATAGRELRPPALRTVACR